jgi:pimeloyl-ACP methyl ester carboxylesterase
MFFNLSDSAQPASGSPDDRRRMRSVRGLSGRLPARYLAASWRTTVAVTGLPAVLGRTRSGDSGTAASPPATVPGARYDDGPRQSVGDWSRWIDLDGPLHYLDFGGPADGPTVVCVHGLLGSAVTWAAIAPLLTGCRVLAPDLAGHGLTRSMGRSTDVRDLRALLHRFIEAVCDEPVILIGNSMGGMLALMEASAAPSTVSGLVLVDPVLPLVPAWPDRFVAPMLAAYAVPQLGPVLMGLRRRMSAEAMVGYVLALCCVDAARVPAEVTAQIVSVARYSLLTPETEREITASARSIIATAGYLRGLAYRRGVRATTCPVLLVHGARDRMVPVSVARAAARANPAWALVVMSDVGHIPQLEAPRETANAITAWLTSAGLARPEDRNATAAVRPVRATDGLMRRAIRLIRDLSPFRRLPMSRYGRCILSTGRGRRSSWRSQRLGHRSQGQSPRRPEIAIGASQASPRSCFWGGSGWI